MGRLPPEAIDRPWDYAADHRIRAERQFLYGADFEVCLSGILSDINWDGCGAAASDQLGQKSGRASAAWQLSQRNGTALSKLTRSPASKYIGPFAKWVRR